jgi:acyl-CoA thioesterase-2
VDAQHTEHAQSEAPPAIDVREVLAVREIAPDRFVSSYVAPSERSLNGGQTAAQALNAAFTTAPSHLVAHSVHVHFIAAGDPLAPVEFDVQRDRDSRAFSTRHVRCHQGDRLVARVTASFHAPEGGPDIQLPTGPELPHPEDCSPVPSHFAGMDVRVTETNPDYVYEPRLWGRPLQPVGDDTRWNACALVYFSDLHSGLPRLLHVAEDDFQTSLDHAVWLHRPFLIDDWVLMDHFGETIADGRSWYRSQVFDRHGVLIASCAQEMLLRPARR